MKGASNSDAGCTVGRRQHGNEENEHSVVGPFPLARVIVAAGADAGLLRGVVETNGYRIAPQVLH